MKQIQIENMETKRLLLDEITEADVKEILILRSDPEMMRYIPRPMCKDEEDAMNLIRLIQIGRQKSDSINWAIRLKENGLLVGTIGYVRIHAEHNKAEIGYMLHKDLFGQGIMSEAMEAILSFGIEKMKLHRIEAVIDPGNIASEKLLKKFGFEYEGHLKENFLFEGRYLDSVHYALLINS